MDDYRQQQEEALKVAHEYCARLISGINNVAGELTEKRLPDTDAYLDEVVKGINWIIEIVNRTQDILNEKETYIEKENVNDAVRVLGEALSKKDDMLIADALKGGVLEFIRQVETATEKY